MIIVQHPTVYGGNLAFVHIPKTAGESIRHALMENFRVTYLGKVNCPKQDIKAKENLYNPHYSPSELSVGFIERLRLITCVRNPWDRFVSWYAWREEKRDFDTFLRQLLGKEPEESKRNPRIPKNSPLQSTYFTSTRNDLALGYQEVLRFENLREDWERFWKGVPEGVETPNLPHRNISKHKPYQSYYSPESIELVEEMEKPLIERFGYTFES